MQVGYGIAANEVNYRLRGRPLPPVFEFVSDHSSAIAAACLAPWFLWVALGLRPKHGDFFHPANFFPGFALWATLHGLVAGVLWAVLVLPFVSLSVSLNDEGAAAEGITGIEVAMWGVVAALLVWIAIRLVQQLPSPRS